MANSSVTQNPAKIPPRAGIGEVVAAELAEIAQRRGEPQPAPDPRHWIQECHKRKLFGVCISGGGIRSATFGLGVLQGLVEKKLLSRADYLSTVSGGGYIGAWLQGVADRGSDYERVLDPERTPQTADKDPITFLRKYSNYLAPRNGLSLDFLVIPLIWFRNMMLNQAIIIAALMALYIVLLLPGAGLRYVSLEAGLSSAFGVLILAVVSASVAVTRIGTHLKTIVKREFDPPATDAQPRVLQQHIGRDIANFLFAAVLLVICALAAIRPNGGGFLVEYLVLFILLALMQWRGGFLECSRARREGVETPSEQTVHKFGCHLIARLHLIWMPGVTAAFMLLLLASIWALCNSFHPAQALGSQLVVAFALPLYFLALIAGVGLHIGLMGRDFPDASREWLARLGALFLTYIAIWSVLFVLGIFAPLGIAKLWLWGTASKSKIGAWIVSSGALTWLLTTIMTVLAGKSSKTGSLNPDQQTTQSKALDLLARYGPFVAITGFLVAIAFAIQWLLHPAAWFAPEGRALSLVTSYWLGLPYCLASWIYPALLFFFLVAVFVVLSYRVNINEFSMHHFYKNRLVRCYLGASAAKLQTVDGTSEQREPDPFTGFDPKDDVKLYKLRSREQEKKRQAAAAREGEELHTAKPRVPYPILNATLTVTAGVELATQERKALPWFFTPLYSGFYPARSDEDRQRRYASETGNAHAAAVDELQHAVDPYADSQLLGEGLSLGTATAIAGAAVNPAMGFHSSPQTAFLLTLFNVRLGWWLGNPTRAQYISSPGPSVALWWLLRELFGFVDESSEYINLSDGGNFENLGLYELVRRRCRYIIVIDAEEDADYRFEALGGAVRKCRADFGVEIEIDPRPILPQPKFSHSHCVMGTIHYPPNEKAEPGYLLYLKSSITGDEPADVEEYRRENSDFPQQSTLEQFFSESQFESYRRLGLHVARTAFDHLGKKDEKELHEVFSRLQSQWLLPPAAPEGAAPRHAAAYAKLLAETAGAKDFDSVVLAKFPAGLSDIERSRFFFHLQLLQFVEQVFLDLDFASAEKWNHPSTAGWRNLIRHWAIQPGMKTVWESQKESYGQPFRNYFDDLVHGRPLVPDDQQR